MTVAVNGFCPECGSGWIRKRYARPWECRACTARFDDPVPVMDACEAQRLLDLHAASAPFWQSAEGQRVLAFAAAHRMRPAAIPRHCWGISFVIRQDAGAARP